jgi:hypothetical protein
MKLHWLAERLAQGELSSDEAATARSRLGVEDVDRRLREIEESNRQILEQHPPAKVAAEVERRFRGERRRWLWALAPAVAAGIVVLIFVRSPPAGDRQKGGGAPRLIMHRQRGGAVERLASGAAVRAHDLVQISYAAAGRSFGVVLSIDGRGKVTLHHPDAGGDNRLQGGGREVLLGHAFELDDAPDFERFFFVVSRTPFATERVLESAERLAGAGHEAAERPLDLPSDLEQTSVVLRKVGP